MGGQKGTISHTYLVSRGPDAAGCLPFCAVLLPRSPGPQVPRSPGQLGGDLRRRGAPGCRLRIGRVPGGREVENMRGKETANHTRFAALGARYGLLAILYDPHLLRRLRATLCRLGIPGRRLRDRKGARKVEGRRTCEGEETASHTTLQRLNQLRAVWRSTLDDPAPPWRGGGPLCAGGVTRKLRDREGCLEGPEAEIRRGQEGNPVPPTPGTPGTDTVGPSPLRPPQPSAQYPVQPPSVA